jgi:hypothetical protein
LGRRGALVNTEAPEIVWGWKSIAAVLGRSVRTAQERAERNRDPLPIFVEDDRIGAYVSAIIDWRARQRQSLKLHREAEMLRAQLERADRVRASVRRRARSEEKLVD